VRNLGKRLRALRNRRGLTLAQLAQQVGLSASYLSQVERSVTTPSLPKLTAIAGVLDVELGYFFEEVVAPPRIVRLNRGKKIASTGGVAVELLSTDPSNEKIQPYRLVCQPGASGVRIPTYPGEEFCFVLKGQLTVTLGEETFVLRAGDSIHYQRLQPHSWKNDGDEECITVWAVSPPMPEAEIAAQAAPEERR
jgi:transcriptional regulator with XRE-family HTH domain